MSDIVFITINYILLILYFTSGKFIKDTLKYKMTDNSIFHY